VERDKRKGKGVSASLKGAKSNRLGEEKEKGGEERDASLPSLLSRREIKRGKKSMLLYFRHRGEKRSQREETVALPLRKCGRVGEKRKAASVICLLRGRKEPSRLLRRTEKKKKHRRLSADQKRGKVLEKRGRGVRSAGSVCNHPQIRGGGRE